MSNSKQPQSQRPKPAGIISSVIGTVFNLSLISISAWLILMAIFTTQLIFKGQNDTFYYLQNIIISNLSFIENSKSLLIIHLVSYVSSVQTITSQHVLTIKNQIIQNALILFVNVTQICLTRLIIFIIAIPFFCILLLVCITDGLVKRDIRKFQGARESTFMFHRSKHLFWFSLFIPFFIYMSTPYPISPLAFLLLQALLLSFIAWLSISHFKKYV